jgi:hypothetical protein
MIIKLAKFTEEEEAKIRKNLANPSAIKSNQLLLNYAHPATILGGATGGFAGSELGDKIFGGTHLVDSFSKISKPTLGLSGRFVKNLFRGSLGTLGAGVGAYGVAKYRQHKEKRKS